MRYIFRSRGLAQGYFRGQPRIKWAVVASWTALLSPDVRDVFTLWHDIALGSAGLGTYRPYDYPSNVSSRKTHRRKNRRNNSCDYSDLQLPPPGMA